MSKAIVLWTMIRFVRWQSVLALVTYSTALGGLVAMGMSTGREESQEFVRGALFGPLVPMMVAYGVLMPQVANYQRAKDGEYLSLLFTRPISRFGYIMSKWAAGSIVVTIIMLVLSCTSLGLSALMGNSSALSLIDGYALCDIVLNAMGYSALAVCVAAFPMQLGVLVFVLLMYGAMFMSLSTGVVSFVGSPFWGSGAFKYALSVIQFTYSFFVVGIDSYHLVNSSQSPIAGALAYVSNLVIYLTIAAWLMSFREFFYAND